MTDQAQRTAWALDRFDSFVADWTPPAMLPHLIDTDDNAAERVRRAILAIAPPNPALPVVGYAVFAQRPDRERECGFEHIALSAVFETLAQAENVLDSCAEKARATLAIPAGERRLLDGSTVTAGELRFFTVCAVQQIPT